MKEQNFSMSVPPAETDKKSEISEAELKDRMQKMEMMGKLIGEDFGVKVEIGKERGWRYYFKPVNKIEVDPEDIRERDLEYCYGVIAHEGSHRKISRIDFIPKKVWKTTGFSFLHNAVEDPRVNNFVMKKYKGANQWVTRTYLEDLPVETLSEKAKKKLGYIPKHMEYGFEVIRYWFYNKFSENLDPDVREALEETNKFAELAYETLPDISNPKEEDITDQAKRMYSIVYNHIWPVYEKLVDKAFDDEEMRQKIKDMLKNGDFDMPPEGMAGNGEPLPLDELPEDLREAIKKKMKEKWDSMTDEEKKEWAEKAAKAAEDTLDGIEDDMNKELKGRLVKQKESAKDEKDKEKADQEAKAKAKEIKKSLRELEKKIREQKSEYDLAYEEVVKHIDDVADELINLFIQQRYPKFKAKFPGQRARLKGAMAWEAQKEYRELFETRQALERQSFTFLLLVDLSGSMGQMNKIDEAFKGAVLMSEALQRASGILGNLKVGIYGFQDKLITFKAFDEEMSDDVRERMSEMKAEVDNTNTEANGRDKFGKGNNGASYNSDAICVDEASRILSAQTGQDKFLIVTSDGRPAAAPDTDVERYKDLSDEEQLKAVIKDISQNTNQYLLGLGIGQDTAHVPGYYDNTLPRVQNIVEPDVHKFAEVLGSKVKELITS